MHKYLKIFITFLIAFNFCILNVFAENETIENDTTVETSTTTEQSVPSVIATEPSVDTTQQIDNAHVKELVNGNYLVIEDDAHLLVDNELILLKEQMKPLTEYGNIVFKTIAVNDRDTYSYATDYYYKNFGNGSGTLLIIDIDPRNRYIYVISEGWNYTIITKSKSEIITDNIYRYASREEYYECAKHGFDQIGTLLNGGKINEPMRYASNIVLSLVAGFFISYLYVLRKSKIKTPKEDDILQNCDIDFNVKSVDVESAGQHKVYSPRSDSSSSGGGHSGGGGSGGGGGFSGGGGGHRF